MAIFFFKKKTSYMTLLLTSKHISDTQSNCKPLTTPYIGDFSTILTTIQKPPTNEEKWFSPTVASQTLVNWKTVFILPRVCITIKVIANFSHLIRMRP